MSGGRPTGANVAAGFDVSGGRPKRTTAAAGFNVCMSGGRPQGQPLLKVSVSHVVGL